MSDPHGISLADIDAKLAQFHARLEDNRRALELLSSSGVLSISKEGRWIRDTLTKRADVLRHLIDQMQRVRSCYLNPNARIQMRDETRKLMGMLLLDNSR